jgi:hypothetical protein
MPDQPLTSRDRFWPIRGTRKRAAPNTLDMRRTESPPATPEDFRFSSLDGLALVLLAALTTLTTAVLAALTTTLLAALTPRILLVLLTRLLLAALVSTLIFAFVTHGSPPSG